MRVLQRAPQDIHFPRDREHQSSLARSNAKCTAAWPRRSADDPEGPPRGKAVHAGVQSVASYQVVTQTDTFALRSLLRSVSGIDFSLFRINNIQKSVVLSRLLIIRHLYNYTFLSPTHCPSVLLFLLLGALPAYCSAGCVSPTAPRRENIECRLIVLPSTIQCFSC
jgi:hypothetical protein